MVWHTEVTGIRLPLKSLPVGPLLVLSDSKVAIPVVQNEEKCGHSSTVDLTPTTTAKNVIFESDTDLRLRFYGFAFVKSVHRSEFCSSSEDSGFVLCFLALRACRHCLCFHTVGFRSSLLSFSQNFNLDWCG